MSIGYACLTIGVPNANMKSCIMKNATKERLIEVIAHNLKSLETIMDYNINNNIKLFRISSDLIPFGSSPINNLPWWELFALEFQRIGEKIRKNSMRVSMHPGQYTVLNSPDQGVVSRAVEDLNYHTKVLDSLGVGANHKIVLHIGGVYNDKRAAMDRFIINYYQLDEKVKERLVIENDDKSYTICEVLEIAGKIKAPVIFDNLHNEINCCEEKSDPYWIDECKKTWDKKDGFQKIHYSQQNPGKKSGSHSQTIRIDEFLEFYEKLERTDLDIMLEVKDKNLSAVKCILCTTDLKGIGEIEKEWSRYKYKVLENSPAEYNKIQKIIEKKVDLSPNLFYTLLEESLEKQNSTENSVYAALHILGCFKELIDPKEEKLLLKNIEGFKKGERTITSIKNSLYKLAVKYNQSDLLKSFYFEM